MCIRDRRIANVAGAFRAAQPQQLEGKRILLVDDVITTEMCIRDRVGAASVISNGTRYETADDMQVYLWYLSLIHICTASCSRSRCRGRPSGTT